MLKYIKSCSRDIDSPPIEVKMAIHKDCPPKDTFTYYIILTKVLIYYNMRYFKRDICCELLVVNDVHHDFKQN